MFSLKIGNNVERGERNEVDFYFRLSKKLKANLKCDHDLEFVEGTVANDDERYETETKSCTIKATALGNSALQH